MTFTRAITFLFLTITSLPGAFAGEAAAPDNADVQKLEPVNTTVSMPGNAPTVEAAKASTSVKTRDDAIAELVKAKSDGTYNTPSEIYPDRAYPPTGR